MSLDPSVREDADTSPPKPRRRIIGRRLLLAAPLALAATAAFTQIQKPAWMVVQGADGSFTVDMPGQPVYKLLDTTSPGGTAFVLHSYSLEFRRLSFVAQTALYPADIDVRVPKANLQGVLDDRARRLEGGRWTRLDWREVQGVPAAESVGSVAGGSVLRQLVVLKGRRFVSLAYLAPADALRTPEADRFFKSFRLGS
ncbi:hypothetical protein [Reyranella sp.]|uniref:hypothetical protein n=1 Tax=Reyranella sp. TaxID=1929291 RepID=UPI003D116380